MLCDECTVDISFSGCKCNGIDFFSPAGGTLSIAFYIFSEVVSRFDSNAMLVSKLRFV